VACVAATLVTTVLAVPPASAGPDGPDGSDGARAASGAFDDGAIDSADDTHGHHQHGGNVGHLPARQSNVELVSKLKLSGVVAGRIADVTVHDDFAYLAAFNEPECTNGGVYVVDIKNVRKPREVGFIATGPGSFVGEGQQVIDINTRSFHGDVLLFNNEICGDVVEGTVGGATLVDVSNPRAPKILAAGFGDLDPEGAGPGVAHQVHSAFGWQAGRKAYAVLVDDEEAADVDIFDITDPHSPVLVAEYDLAQRYPGILQAGLGLDQVFFHDVVVKEIRGHQIMLLSYWDAGYVTLDVTDPTNPVFIADSDMKNPDPELLAQTGLSERPEGNAHEAEFTKDNKFIIGADEDFGPTGIRGRTDDGGTFTGNQGDASQQLTPGQTLTGKAVYVGLACTGGDPVPPAPATGGPYVALVERGTCTFTEKVGNVEAAGGYAGTVITNREGADGCGNFGMTVVGTKPVVSVDRRTGFSFFDIEAQYDEAVCRAGDGTARLPVAIGTQGDVVTVESFFNGWGYVHLFTNNAGKLRELDTYAIPEAMDSRFATGFGDLSVHEVATSHRDANLAYLSYYAGGFRVIKIDHGKIVEVGSFIDTGGNNFWGVQVFERGGKEYVAASDRDFGLYIFRYTGRR